MAHFISNPPPSPFLPHFCCKDAKSALAIRKLHRTAVYDMSSPHTHAFGCRPAGEGMALAGQLPPNLGAITGLPAHLVAGTQVHEGPQASVLQAPAGGLQHGPHPALLLHVL